MTSFVELLLRDVHHIRKQVKKRVLDEMEVPPEAHGAHVQREAYTLRMEF